jgi:hypothetical protein
LDNIKLDYEFQRGSKNWAKQFDSNDVKSNETSKTKSIFSRSMYSISRSL